MDSLASLENNINIIIQAYDKYYNLAIQSRALFINNPNQDVPILDMVWGRVLSMSGFLALSEIGKNFSNIGVKTIVETDRFNRATSINLDWDGLIIKSLYVGPRLRRPRGFQGPKGVNYGWDMFDLQYSLEGLAIVHAGDGIDGLGDLALMRIFKNKSFGKLNRIYPEYNY